MQMQDLKENNKGWFSKIYLNSSSDEELGTILRDDGWEEIADRNLNDSDTKERNAIIWHKTLPEKSCIEARLAYASLPTGQGGERYVVKHWFTDHKGFKEIAPPAVVGRDDLAAYIMRHILTKTAAYMEEGMTDISHNEIYKRFRRVGYKTGRTGNLLNG